jgi:excisionase family DNA binding protein
VDAGQRWWTKSHVRGSFAGDWDPARARLFHFCSTFCTGNDGQWRGEAGFCVDRWGKPRQVPGMDPSAELPELWDVDQLAGYLGVGRRFVYRLTEQRRIRFVRVGGKLRFDPADVADYLARESQEVACVPDRRGRSGRPARSATGRAVR